MMNESLFISEMIPKSSIDDALSQVLQDSFCSQDVHGIIQNEVGEKLRKVVGNIKESNQIPRNVIISQENNQAVSTYPENSNGNSQALDDVSQESIDKILDRVSKKYENPDHVSEGSAVLKRESTNKLLEILSNISQQKINQVLQGMASPYLSFSVETFKLNSTKSETCLDLGLLASLKTLKPFVAVSLQANFVKKQISKVVFLIDGHLEIPDIQILAKKDSFSVDPGTLYGELKISLKKVKVFDRTAMGSDDDGDVKELVSKKIERELPEITIP